MKSGRRGFAAVLTPRGVHVVRYERVPGGLRAARYAREEGPYDDPREAAGRLAELVEAEGGRGARLALAVSGFGTFHQVLSLPPAPPELLAPVVARELARLHVFELPGLEDPVTGFARLGPPAGGPQPVLAAAAPRPLLDALAAALGARRIALEHVTVVPQAVQRLYAAFVAAPGPAVVALLAPDSPVLAAFWQGALRLCWELILRQDGGAPADLTVLADRVRYGRLYLEQEFRPTSPVRVLLAAEPAEREAAERALGATVERLGPEGVGPGALLALGAALDALDEGGLNLLPGAPARVARAERLARRLAGAGAAVLVTAALWWAWQGLGDAERAARRAEAARRALETRSAALAGIEPVLLERRAHAERVALLESLAGERARVYDVLAAVAAATPAAVRLDSLSLRRGGDRKSVV